METDDTQLNEMIQSIKEEVTSQRLGHIEALIRIYLKSNNLKVTDVELVQRIENQEIVFYIRPKTKD